MIFAATKIGVELGSREIMVESFFREAAELIRTAAASERSLAESKAISARVHFTGRPFLL